MSRIATEDFSFRTLDKQKHAKITITHPLESDDFNVRRVRVREHFDEPFEIVIDLVSQKPDIDFRDLIGKSVGIGVAFGGENDRSFHGIVKTFENQETPHFQKKAVTHYRMVLVPKFWLMKLTTDCKVFQDMSVLDIVQEVLGDNEISDFEINCQQAGKTVREYCVQYNESDFDFVSRLLEEEGIFYFFKFESGKHILILTDNVDTLKDASGAEKLKVSNAKLNEYILNRVYSLNPSAKITSKDFTQRDYNMTNASALLESMQKGSPENAEQYGELYHYSGQFDHEDIPEQSRLEILTKIRLEAIEAQQSILAGTTSSPFLSVGLKFELQDHMDEKRNKKYVVKFIDHIITNDEAAAEFDDNYYFNTIHVFEDTRIYRPVKDTRKPRINSIHSAVVTGPEGEEIWTDNYGRIKIQFPWDRLGNKDEKSSCWVRVLQGWGGNNWGVLFTPRIGMEVMVTFIEGDPNRPVVTGCLYNSDHMPPYLPERVTEQMMPTKSTFKTNSSKGGDGFNEFRFEDLKGEEQIYTRAEKDYDKYVRQNMTLHVESGSVWESVDQGDRDIALYGGGDAKEKTTPEGQAHPKGAGDDFLEITTGNRSTTFLSKNGAILDSLHIIEGDRAEQIDKGNTWRINTKGNVNQYIDEGNHGELINQGNKNTSIKTGNMGIDVETGNYGVHVKTGDQVYYVETGNHYTEVTTGNHKALVDTGDYAIEIKEGNMGMTLDEGNRSTHLKSGNYNLTLDSGNQTEKVIGDVTETIIGDFTNETSGNYTLTISGNLDLNVTGAITIIAGEGISICSGGSIAMASEEGISLSSGDEMGLESGAAMELTSAADISATSGAAMSFESGAAMEMVAAADITMETEGAFEVESVAAIELSGLDVSITGEAAIELEAAADVSIAAGASVNIETAAVVIA